MIHKRADGGLTISIRVIERADLAFEHFRFVVAMQSIHDFGAANSRGNALLMVRYVPYAPRTAIIQPSQLIIEPALSCMNETFG